MKAWGTIKGYVCSGCGARILSELDFPSTFELKECGLPLDCDEAVISVIHGSYSGWNPNEFGPEEPIWD